MSDMQLSQIPKLSAKNFQAWRFTIKNVLIANGLLQIADGTEARPKEPENKKSTDPDISDNISAWERKNARAVIIIITTMSENLANDYTTFTTAEALWKKLAQVFERRSEESKLVMSQQFQNFAMSPTDTVTSYISKLRVMATALKEVGETVSETTMMAKILNGLPQKYSNFATAWDSVDPVRQNVDSLKERLIKQEEKMNKNERESTALFSAAKSTGNFHRKPKHFERGQQQQQGDRTENLNKRDIVCYACGKQGHIASKCRNRKKNNNNSSKPPPNRLSKHPRDIDSFVTTVCVNQSTVSTVIKRKQMTDDIAYFCGLPREDVWLIDSAASRHITYR